MRLVSLTVVGATTSAVCPINIYANPVNIALNAQVTGTVSYTVQYTFDDVFALNYNPASGNWTNHPTLTAQTVTKDSNIAYPVRGVRITQTGTGTTVLTIIEAGGGMS